MILGSFGSVLLGRLGDFSLSSLFHKKEREQLMNARKGILIGRSACPICHHTLHAIDLIPLGSYLATGGKCRYCKTPISRHYPLLEVGCGIVFALLGGSMFFLGITGQGYIHEIGITLSQSHIVLRFLTTRLLYLLLIYDSRTMFLHEFVWGFSILAAGGLILSAPQGIRQQGLIWGCVSFLFFRGFYRFAKLYVRIRFHEWGEGFGLGDVWLSPIIGIMLGIREGLRRIGPKGFPEGFSFLVIYDFISYIIIASCVGLLYALIHKIIAPKQSVRRIPFFPGMIIALRAMMAWIIWIG